MSQFNESVVPPGLDDVIDQSKRDVFSTFNAVEIGEVRSYDPDTQSASIRLVIKRRVSESEIRDMPLLVDCPVFVLQGGGKYVDLPIEQGDTCLVLFCDRDIDTWWTTGNRTTPSSGRKHALSDGVALVGVNTRDNAPGHDGARLTSRGGSPQPAAREGDSIEIDSTSDPAFFAWLSTVGTATGAGAPPEPITGRIASGSTEWGIS